MPDRRWNATHLVCESPENGIQLIEWSVDQSLEGSSGLVEKPSQAAPSKLLEEGPHPARVRRLEVLPVGLLEYEHPHHVMQVPRGVGIGSELGETALMQVIEHLADICSTSICHRSVIARVVHMSVPGSAQERAVGVYGRID
ncbi:hypothetical protein [Enhygromyxa salina]|uniref:hypothetical protein n=1 Tax=Enhygromyxa salina TaxID=215803 RepID=UPI0004E6176F|nr:hypothetical protein [Enhygromyxa salina]